MKLVLTDIANWKTQLEGEIQKIDEQILHLQGTKTVAQQKIAEATELLEKFDFSVEEPVAEAEEETVEKAVASS